MNTLGVNLNLSTRVDNVNTLKDQYDEIILATGVNPRIPDLPGMDHSKVITYVDALYDRKPVGKSVAIIGAGGIGFDVAEYVTHEGPSSAIDRQLFYAEWGVDPDFRNRGGLASPMPPMLESPRSVYLMQRKTSKLGVGLGKTTGWIHRSVVRRKNVQMVAGCTYLEVSDDGLHYEQAGEEKVLDVETVILCSGQVSDRTPLDDSESARGIHLIGGAKIAAELDALRAIREGTELAAGL